MEELPNQTCFGINSVIICVIVSIPAGIVTVTSVKMHLLQGTPYPIVLVASLLAWFATEESSLNLLRTTWAHSTQHCLGFSRSRCPVAQGNDERVHTYIHTDTLHYIKMIMFYIALHYITLHDMTWHDIIFHYILTYIPNLHRMYTHTYT